MLILKSNTGRMSSTLSRSDRIPQELLVELSRLFTVEIDIPGKRPWERSERRRYMTFVSSSVSDLCRCLFSGARELSKCNRADVLIVEDDPYYFLQEGSYVPKSQRTGRDASLIDDEAYIASLVPSFLK